MGKKKLRIDLHEKTVGFDYGHFDRHHVRQAKTGNCAIIDIMDIVDTLG